MIRDSQQVAGAGDDMTTDAGGYDEQGGPCWPRGPSGVFDFRPHFDDVLGWMARLAFMAAVYAWVGGSRAHGSQLRDQCSASGWTWSARTTLQTHCWNRSCRKAWAFRMTKPSLRAPRADGRPASSRQRSRSAAGVWNVPLWSTGAVGMWWSCASASTWSQGSKVSLVRAANRYRVRSSGTGSYRIAWTA